MAQTTPDHCPHSLRDRELEGGSVRQAPLGSEQPYHLANEERVPLGLSMDRADELRGGLEARAQLDEVLDVSFAQARQRDQAGRLPAGQLGQGRREWIPECGVDVAIGGDDQDA